MIRILKFRAFCGFDKTWVYFNLTESNDVPSGFYGGMSDWQQFTGMKDKTGNDVYEGDIIKFEEYWDGDCRYNGGGFAVVKYFDNSFDLEETTRSEWMDLWNCLMNWGGVVVGNIHEAPDLDKLTNRCLRCNRVVVGLKPGDMHDHVERCPQCGRTREMKPND